MIPPVRITIAALYIVLLCAVFVGLQYADPSWAEGGIPLVILGLPWSVLVSFVALALSVIPRLGNIITTEGGNFFLFVVVCGSLNGALIVGDSRVWRLLRYSARFRAIAAVCVVILVGGVQAIMPGVERDALERSRPRNVSRDAVHVGGAIGWWANCTCDPQGKSDTCSIWNRGGVVLEQGEFVPYDGGSPARTDALEISQLRSGPDIVGLRNGRILLPKAREVEMRRFLDGQTGNRPNR